MDISVVIPLYNEAESLPELFSWIERVMDEHHFTYEVIFVDDGSTDDSWKIIECFKQQSACVHGIRFRRNYGKSLVCIADFRGQKVTWSLPWMPICKTVRMKSPNCTA